MYIRIWKVHHKYLPHKDLLWFNNEYHDEFNNEYDDVVDDFGLGYLLVISALQETRNVKWVHQCLN